MTILVECCHANLFDEWLNVNAADPYAFVPMAFATEMARRGHRVICALGTRDRSETMTLDGVEIIGAVGAAFPRIEADLILWNSWLNAIESNLGRCFTAKKMIWRIHASLRQVQAFRYLGVISRFDLVLASVPSEAQFLAPVCKRIEWMPFGVNVEAVQSCRSERVYDVCAAASLPHKGRDFVIQVLDEVKRQGGKATENLTGKSKQELWSIFGKSNIFFYPSSADGFARVVTEAAAAGCMVVVASGSPSCVEHAHYLGGVVIDIPIKADHYTYQTTANPSAIAAQLLAMPYRPCRVTPELDGALELQRYCSYAEELLGLSSSNPSPEIK